MPKILLLVLIAFFDQAYGQDNNWMVLADVKLEKQIDPNGYEIDRPKFGALAKAANGKKIRLKGYLIPLNELNANSLMLSSLPFNVCYFCGAAGPETVVEVQPAEKIPFRSEPIIIEGILMLNESDPDHHIYILKSALAINP